MKKTRYTSFLSALLALLIMASLIPLASCGGPTGADKNPEPGTSQVNTSAEDIQAQIAQAQEPAPPSPQEEAISALQDAGATASALAADPARAATDTETLKASVDENTAKLTDVIFQTADKLSELGLDSKQKRFAEASSKMLSAIDGVKAASDGINSADPASYGLLSQVVGEVFASPEPAVLSSDLSHRIEPDTPVPPTYGTSIAPAYLSGSPGLTPSSLPAEPGDEDLVETPDAPQTEEIATLAEQLGHDPVAIYEWVRNNIDFESYYGSRKGAHGCLKEMAGNSTDTSSLLIALYRASGISARYVTGVIELTADQACSWLAVDTVSDAQSLLASGGIPVTGIVEAGAVSKLQLTQTWAEAWVNYENYRGAAGGDGPSCWIPLDASYKTYEVYQPQVDILSVMGEDYDSLSAEYLSTMREETLLSFIETKAKTWLSANMPQLTLADVMRTKSIKQENLGLLPPGLLYKLISAESEERELPTSSRWCATLTMAGTSFACDLVSLASGALEVSFAPASEEDEALLAAYENIQDIPAYLLDMVGEMTAGEQAVQTQSRPFGSSSSWSTTISSPGRSYRIDNTLAWGAPFSVALAPTPGPVNGEITLEMGPNFPACLFDQAANAYISSITGDDDELASIFGLSLTKGVQEASIGISLALHTASGVVVSAAPDGIYIDADLSTATPAGKTKSDRRDFTMTSGLSGSAHEHKCLENQFSAEAVSTAKLLALANQNEIPIADIDRGNASAFETLALPAYVKQQMKDQVNAGCTVTTPTRQITYQDFIGEGWMVIDPQTGEGAYLISGSVSGGKTIEGREDWGFFWRTMILRKHFDKLDILAPQEGAGFVKGESVKMIVKYTWTDNDTYTSVWSINTARKEYIPGGYYMEVKTKKTDPEITSSVGWNLFGVFSQEEENSSLLVQAQDLQGRPISGKYWDKGTGSELDVKTNWAWEENQTHSYARGARFLDQGVVIEHPELDPYLSEAGNDSVSFQLGVDGGLYRTLYWPGCPYFISYEDKEQALNERIFDQVSRSRPLVFNLNQGIRLEFVKDSSGRPLGVNQRRGSGQFIDPFVVRVINRDGVPVPEASVEFSAIPLDNPDEANPVAWYGYRTYAAGQGFSEYYGPTYPPPGTAPLETDGNGKTRACMKISDNPPIAEGTVMSFLIKITAKSNGSEATLFTNFFCFPFTVDADGDGTKDMRPEDITYQARRLQGIAVPHDAQRISPWEDRKNAILDVMLRYDEYAERKDETWPTWKDNFESWEEPEKFEYNRSETRYMPELYITCIEVPRTAYYFAHVNIPGNLAATWNWAEFFYSKYTSPNPTTYLKGRIFKDSGTTPICENVEYSLADVIFVDLNSYEYIDNDSTKAFPDHSGMVVDIVGDGDKGNIDNICVIAADFFPDGRFCRMFDPIPYSNDDEELRSRNWLRRYQNKEFHEDRGWQKEGDEARFFSRRENPEAPEGREEIIVDEDIRIFAWPSAYIYHGGFKR